MSRRPTHRPPFRALRPHGLAAMLMAALPLAAAHGQVFYGATGGQSTTMAGNGGNAGEPGANGASGPALGGAAGTLLSPDGGDGDPSFSLGTGGGGGGGGYSHIVTGDIVADLQGGHGGHGGDSFDFPGNGGAGGDGARFMDPSPSLTVSATVRGGNGGTTLSSSLNEFAAGGGGAGLVLVHQGTLTLTNTAMAAGGQGGDSGLNSRAGGGGGAGVVLNAGGTVYNQGQILGAAGGKTGAGGAGLVSGGQLMLYNDGVITGGAATSFRAGGAGLDLKSGGTVVNRGQITGGAGSTGSSGITAPTLRGGTGSGGAPGFRTEDVPTRGLAGAAILGGDLDILNTGSITGGLSSYFGRSPAVVFTGGANRLELGSGWTITGDVDASASLQDTLVLGGASDSSLDASRLRAAADPGATDQFIGFEHFHKTGGGTWTLTGATSASTPWTITDGVLAASQDASLGAPGAPHTLDGGTLRVDAGWTQTDHALHLGAAHGTISVASADGFLITQAIQGTGGLTLDGAGPTRLAADNLYTGPTRVTGSGGLQLGTGGATGSVAGDLEIGAGSSLTWLRTSDLSYAGALSGAGTLDKQAANTLTLTGDSSAFGGHTRVQAGRLQVGAQGSGSLGGQVTVSPGATLGGTGVVGSAGREVRLDSGATLAPGNSLGTLRVGGDLWLAPGALFEVEADAQGGADRVEVAGRATVEGAHLRVLAQPGDFAPRTAYTILQAHELQGRFGQVDANYEYLVPELQYGQQDLILTLVRKTTPTPTPDPAPAPPMPFRDAAVTFNQRATADGVESLPSWHPVHRAVETLPRGTAPAAFDALSGEIHAAVQGALRLSASQVREPLLASLRHGWQATAHPAAGGGGTNPPGDHPRAGWGLWAQA